MAIDPSVDYNAKQILNRQIQAGPPLPTQQVSASPQDYANAGIAPPSLPTQTVQATPADYAAAGVAPTTGGLSFLRSLANTMSAPTGVAGVGQGGSDPASLAIGQITSPRIAAAQTAAAAPAAASGPAPTFNNVQGSSYSTAVNPSDTPALASGVTRYDLGGDGPGSPNATRIYATRGQHGEDVFTDNANYAARVSTGGLRRGQTGTDAVYNNAQPGANNPNANYQYAPSTLEQQHGITPDQLGNLSPQAAQQALAYSSAAASANRGTDQGLSDQMDANLLRSRVIGGAQGGGYGGSVYGGGGAGGVNMAGLPATTQNAIEKTLNTKAYQQGQLALRGQQLKISQDADQRAGSAQQQQQFQQGIDAYENQKKVDPLNAPSSLTSMFQTDPDKLAAQLQTPQGKQLAALYMNDVLKPGAAAATEPFSPGQQTGVNQLRYSNLAINPKDGSFNGFMGGKDDDPSDPTYSASRGLTRRLFEALPWTGDTFYHTQNYNPSTQQLTPAQLKVFKDSGL